MVDDDVTVPPRSSVVVFVRGDASENSERLAEGNTNLLLEKNICVARSLVHLRDGCAHVLLTNFGNEIQHVAKGTAIASLHEFDQLADLCAMGTEGPEASDPKAVL